MLWLTPTSTTDSAPAESTGTASAVLHQILSFGSHVIRRTETGILVEEKRIGTGCKLQTIGQAQNLSISFEEALKVAESFGLDLQTDDDSIYLIRRESAA
jgi:hypothetical protein